MHTKATTVSTMCNASSGESFTVQQTFSDRSVCQSPRSLRIPLLVSLAAVTRDPSDTNSTTILIYHRQSEFFHTRFQYVDTNSIPPGFSLQPSYFLQSCGPQCQCPQFASILALPESLFQSDIYYQTRKPIPLLSPWSWFNWSRECPLYSSSAHHSLRRCLNQSRQFSPLFSIESVMSWLQIDE